MHLAPVVGATFALAGSWSVGLAFTVALADAETGLIRDHPSFGRRLSSQVAPYLIGMGLLSVLAVEVAGHPGHPPPTWVSRSAWALLPFALVAYRWSRTWLRRTPAAVRRSWGWSAVGTGVLGMLAASLTAQHFVQPPWTPALPLAVWASTGALLGAVTNRLLLVLTAHLPAQMETRPAPVVTEVAAGGLLLSALPFIQVLPATTGGTPPAVLLAAAWGAGLAIAAAGLYLGVRARPRWGKMIWSTVLVAAVAAQLSALLLLYEFPGLVPPPE